MSTQNLALFAGIVAGCGILFFFFGISSAKSAPQEASIAAMTLAGVVPFYILARCTEMYHAHQAPRPQQLPHQPVAQQQQPPQRTPTQPPMPTQR